MPARHRTEAASRRQARPMRRFPTPRRRPVCRRRGGSREGLVLAAGHGAGGQAWSSRLLFSRWLSSGGCGNSNRDLDVSLSRHIKRGPYGIYGMAYGPHQEAKGPTTATPCALLLVVVPATDSCLQAPVKRLARKMIRRRQGLAELSGDSTTPASPGGEAGVVLTAAYSGIQTPKNQNPHWLNPGSHTGVS